MSVRICKKCKKEVERQVLVSTWGECPYCHNLLRIHAYRRIDLLADNKQFVEWDANLPFVNPLDFEGYEEKSGELREKTNLPEAVVCGQITIDGHEVAIGVMDSRFMMASMGHIVGEKISRLFEKATAKKLPVILYSCSGGARMQEGIISLMQMAKTAEAVKKHSDAGLLYISVLTDPTTGGVTASFASLGDIILAEKGAMIGFAGPRVIENTTHQKLPEGFQRAEFLLGHGFVDAIVERSEQKKVLSHILTMYDKPFHGHFKLPYFSRREMPHPLPQEMTAWERVKVARSMNRPTGKDYIDALFPDFMEFHGDRYAKDDPAIIGGLATFLNNPVIVIAQQKGKHSVEEAVYRNFGMPGPDGYRKALRLMKLAEKFNMPVICFVDTPGAYPGIEAEERGQGEAIARNLYEMSTIKVPIVSIVVGEGSSGGALALAVSDEVWMLENAVYSILSPEGFASILYKDGEKAPEAAEKMRMLSMDLKELGVVEHIIHETKPVTRDDMESVVEQITLHLVNFINHYSGMSKARLLKERYKRFRKF